MSISEGTAKVEQFGDRARGGPRWRCFGGVQRRDRGYSAERRLKIEQERRKPPEDGGR